MSLRTGRLTDSELLCTLYSKNSEPDNICRVGGASQVRYVDSMHQCRLRRVSVEVELQHGGITVRHQSNAADRRTTSDAVDVQRLDDHADELRHALEVVQHDAAGRVQCEHHVRAVRASYTGEKLASTRYTAQN